MIPQVVGVVCASKSAKFKVGDPVMALPSSYFKAHTGSKQEWYREDIHSVLLENFPVRGAFSQVYTSHELYSYKLKEVSKEMIAAQGLGTVLRLARKLGPVIGKTVAIVGQGQNGACVPASVPASVPALAAAGLQCALLLAALFGVWSSARRVQCSALCVCGAASSPPCSLVVLLA